jgi:glutamate-1-semialdehyde 2,1-aminomutase
LPVKQGSISFAHSIEDIEKTLEKTELVIKQLFESKLSLSK